MTDFARETDATYAYPSDAEIALYIAQAHQMRSKAIHDVVIGLWTMLRRNIVRKPNPVQAHPA